MRGEGPVQFGGRQWLLSIGIFLTPVAVLLLFDAALSKTIVVLYVCMSLCSGIIYISYYGLTKIGQKDANAKVSSFLLIILPAHN